MVQAFTTTCLRIPGQRCQFDGKAQFPVQFNQFGQTGLIKISPECPSVGTYACRSDGLSDDIDLG